MKNDITELEKIIDRMIERILNKIDASTQSIIDKLDKQNVKLKDEILILQEKSKQVKDDISKKINGPDEI